MMGVLDHMIQEGEGEVPVTLGKRAAAGYSVTEQIGVWMLYVTFAVFTRGRTGLMG